jgi:hypothetical protein
MAVLDWAALVDDQSGELVCAVSVRGIGEPVGFLRESFFNRYKL